MLTIRNIFIGLTILLLLIGGFFAFLSARVAQGVLIDTIISERAAQVQSLGDTLFSSSDFVAPNGRSASPSRIAPILQGATLVGEDGVALGGVTYFRFIHIGSKQILASNREDETNLFFTRLPELSAQTRKVHIDPSGGEVEITYRGGDTYALWLGISRNEIITSTGVLLVQQQILTALMMVTIIVILFALGYFFIKRPMNALTKTLDEIGKGNFATRLHKVRNVEFGRLFEKFNQVMINISTVHQRDELVSSMKSDFITTAAHQLRTPLSAVKWALKVILDQDFGPLNVDQKSLLMKGYESNDRMIRLVNDLLDVDRIDSGRTEYQFGPTDLISLIESVIAVLTPRVTEQNITIEFPRSPKKIPNVRADTGKLRQVVQNVLDNAVKYSLKNGKVIIRVKETRDGFVELSVIDSGIGIPKDQQLKLFNKFFRADNARKLQTDGSGLGLYILKQIIEKHSGRVSFTSEEGKGTTFTISIPVYKSN